MNPAQAKAAYARALASTSSPGELVTLVRLGDAGPYIAHAFEAPIVQATDLPGAAQQNTRKAVVLADDVVTSGFPLPFRIRQDRLLWVSGRSNAIAKIAERRIQGVIVAYEFELEGA